MRLPYSCLPACDSLIHSAVERPLAYPRNKEKKVILKFYIIFSLLASPYKRIGLKETTTQENAKEDQIKNISHQIKIHSFFRDSKLNDIDTKLDSEHYVNTCHHIIYSAKSKH